MRTTRRQTITGSVVSTRMQKTVVVEVETLKQHPQYKKFVRFRKKYKVHDEEGKCELGDVVLCAETRPISKDKAWRVVEILRRRYVSTAEIVETDELVMKKQKQAIKAEEEPVEQQVADEQMEPASKEEEPEKPESE
jgi:small subunit ribosomal protein S17